MRNKKYNPPEIPPDIDERLAQNLKKLHPEYPEKAIDKLARSYAKQAKINRKKVEAVMAGGIDKLTGLVNKGAMERALSREIQRANRNDADICVIMVDLDHFKKINDDLGHKVGDIALREMGGIIRSAVREIDIPVRYGGEEFVIILPGTSIENASSTAERLRKAVEEKLKPAVKEAVANEKGLKIGPEEIDKSVQGTASVGVSDYHGVNQVPDIELIRNSLIGKADIALYAAKGKKRTPEGNFKDDPSMGNRNCVYVLDEDGKEPILFSNETLEDFAALNEGDLDSPPSEKPKKRINYFGPDED
jgi:diguanylate cyclase (GGDEF)-like protein